MSQKIHLNSEEVKIGKLAFELILDRQGDLSCLEEFIKQYPGKLSLSKVQKCIRGYKYRAELGLNPMPTLTQLSLYEEYKSVRQRKKYQELKEAQKTGMSNVVNLLLSAENDEEIESIFANYTFEHIVDYVKKYCINNPKEEENVKKLTSIVFNMRSKIEKKNMPPHTKQRKEEFKNIVFAFIESNHPYPFFIIQNHNMNSATFKSYLALFKEGNEEEKKIYQLYVQKYQQKREDFVNLVDTIASLIEDGIESNGKKRPFDIIDFYQMTHMSIPEFSSFMTSPLTKEKISAAKINNILDYLKQYSVGSSKLSTIDIKNLTYSYNGKTMTEEDINRIISYLNAENIPVNLNTIHLCFEKIINGQIVLGKNFE